MWSVVAVIIACSNPGQCQPFIGPRMAFGECMATSMSMLADFHNQFPHFNPKLSRIMCVEPRRVDTILGRNKA